MPRALLALTLLVTIAGAPSLAGPDVVFSTAVDQYAQTTEGGAVLRHQGACRTLSGVIERLELFLPAALGMDAVDVQPDGTVLFSVITDGLIVIEGQTTFLSQDRVYAWDPTDGTITTALDCPGLGIQIGTLDAVSRLSDGRFVFSTSESRFVNHAGGSMVLQPHNAYSVDPETAMLELVFDGLAMGLPAIDAVHAFDDGRVVISTTADVFVWLPGGGEVLRHQSAYLLRGDSVATMFDGLAHTIYGVDAIDLESFSLTVDVDELSWNGSSLAGGYDVVAGSLGMLRATHGNFATSTLSCLADGIEETFLPLTLTPGSNAGFWFLVREVSSGATGTYDAIGSGQVAPRDAEIASSTNDCP